MINPDLEKNILACMPYRKPFFFVDHLLEVSENEISGTYRFREDEGFYQGHFAGNPITPGVILLECMGQIGLVCFAIYLLNIHQSRLPFLPVLSHLESDFLAMVRPGETVTVHAEKVYFRNNLLKCRIRMNNEKNETVLTTTAICHIKGEDS